MKLHGIKVQHKKNTADLAPARLSDVSEVCIPMSMHIGKPAKIIVKRGDSVKLGQVIGERDGFLSVPVHASVSGTVSKVEDITMSTGQRVPAVFIKSDGLNEVYEGIAPPEVNDYRSFVEAIEQSGVVGLGGAGFPTFVKINVKDLDKIEEVVINAAECEPYITSDTRTMIDKPDYVFKAIEAGKKYMGVKRFIIGIEDNKKEAIKIMKKYAEKTDGVEVKVLPSIYPQGGEKVLVYNTTGKVIPKGGLPLDVGVIVVNVTTLAFCAEYMETGMPLIEKCVTVDGSAVNEPANVIAPIGAPIENLFEACGGLKREPAKILYGGPMMGIAVPSTDTPVLKMTNAVIAMDEKEAAPPKTTPCINCGNCLRHCPFKLDPKGIMHAYNIDDAEALEALHVDLCMECGCCSYVCPAKRPLVQTNKLAKIKLREYLNSKKEEGTK
ncbi:MAG: electron transport complex subunit RsxC [Ruminococcus sp.]|nr:electron transport complex subunit RsxC [Ruminococcus sp.]